MPSAAPARPLHTTVAAFGKAEPEFHYQDIFETTGELETPWRKLTGDFVKTIQVADQE